MGGRDLEASQGNPLKFTMCTLLDQRFSKYIKIRICHTLRVFLQIFPEGQNGGWATWGEGLSGNYVKWRGGRTIFWFFQGVDLASLVVWGVKSSNSPYRPHCSYIFWTNLHKEHDFFFLSLKAWVLHERIQDESGLQAPLQFKNNPKN